MSLENYKLVLVEDDPIMGESLVQRLAIEGAKVTWWRTRAEATKGLTYTVPDAVICDIRLPDGNGEDVFREARRWRNPSAFLFITAYADIDQAVRLMKSGAGDYLTKPFEMQALLARIQGLLGSGRVVANHAPDLRSARGEAERAMIRLVLAETDGKIGEAAKRLKVSRTTIRTRMKALGIKPATDVRKPEH